MAGAQHRIERRLAAIFAADVAGYSRLMAQDEVGTLRALTVHREVMDRLIAEHAGRIANTAGDSVLASFSSAVDAVQCAVEVQNALADLNIGADPDRTLRFRIGIHTGDVMVRGGDLLGDGVNIAARLEGIAEPGGVCVSGATYDYVRKTLPLTFTDLGPQQVKNIEEPVHAFAWAPSRAEAPTKPPPVEANSLPDKPSIAVLPFNNMSGDPEQEYFADGVVEDIITALSRVRWFFVIARNSSFTYKGKAVDIRQVGRELGVRYVLEGSIRKSGSRVRITGQLIEAASGRHVWADRYDGDLSDVFELQDRITESVVGAIEPNIQQAEIERAIHKSTTNLDAYDNLLCALPLIAAASRESIEQAKGHLTKAIKADPKYAYAMALLSMCHRYRVLQAWGSENDTQEGLQLARDAIALGHNDPLALAEAATSVAYLARDYDGAARVMERSLALHPASALIQSKAGWLRVYMDEPQQAKAHFERAMKLSPVDLEMYQFLTGLSVAQLQMEQWIDGCASAQRALDLRPNWATAHRCRIVGLVHLGMIEEAEEAGRQMSKAVPTFSVAAYSKTMPFRTDAFASRILFALRKAGLPE